MLQAIQEMDGAALLWVQSMRWDVLNPLVALYTTLGNAGLMWIVLSLIMLCSPKTRKAGVLSLASMLLGLLCTNVILKHLVARPRPWLDVAGLTVLVNVSDPNSFPSGHTCAAFAAGMIWLRTLPWKWGRVAAVVLAVCMGLSRLYVGVHYPSDVLAGALVGTFCAWAVWSVYPRMERSKKR